MISEEQKRQVARACNEYAVAKGWISERSGGVSRMAQLTKVNIAYMSHIMRSNFTYRDSKRGENKAIADGIGFSLEKEYWPHVATPQFREMDLELREALSSGAPPYPSQRERFGEELHSGTFSPGVSPPGIRRHL